MKLIKAKIKNTKRIKKDIYLLSFVSGYLARRSRPGQFVHIRVPSPHITLRRPFSIHKVMGKDIYILFRVRGKGTDLLAHYQKGDPLDLIAPLGRGFDYVPEGRSHQQNILIAGGMGVAPLIYLAQKLKKKRGVASRHKDIVLLGAKTKGEIVCEHSFKTLAFKVVIATEDGSRGIKGTAIKVVEKMLSSSTLERRVNLYACGPKEMLYSLARVVQRYPEINCQISFEQFMGCGLGICLGCAIDTKHGYRRVCKDGPVFNIGEVF
jgi:dihydroorotate dehydrogenase electron transfer subunit